MAFYCCPINSWGDCKTLKSPRFYPTHKSHQQLANLLITFWFEVNDSGKSLIIRNGTNCYLFIHSNKIPFHVTEIPIWYGAIHVRCSDINFICQMEIFFSAIFVQRIKKTHDCRLKRWATRWIDRGAKSWKSQALRSLWHFVNTNKSIICVNLNVASKVQLFCSENIHSAIRLFRYQRTLILRFIFLSVCSLII